MARFDRLTVYNTLLADGVLPLFYHADTDTAKQVVGAVARGGARLLEFTNRGDGAFNVFGEMVKYAIQAHPDLILGVGSIEDAPTAALYLAQGANFVVAPNFNPEVSRLCNRRKIPYIPGCSTVSEIAEAEESGVEIIKLFPAEAFDSQAFIKTVLAPRPWTRIMPSGGVSPDEANLRGWFDAGVSCVGMGSRIIRSDHIKSGDFTAMERQVRDTLAAIRAVRGSS